MGVKEERGDYERRRASKAAWSLDVIQCGRLVRQVSGHLSGGDRCLKTSKCWQGWGEIKTFAHFNGNSECWSYYRKQYGSSQKYIETTLMARWIYKENARYIFVYICGGGGGGFPGSTSGKEPTCKDRRIRDVGSIPESGRFPGKGHGNPLQHSYLENPTDRGAWWATVHRVAKSWTWLKRERIQTIIQPFKKEEMPSFATTWMKLEDTTLSKTRQS